MGSVSAVAPVRNPHDCGVASSGPRRRPDLRAVAGRRGSAGCGGRHGPACFGHLGFDLVSGSDMRLLAPFVDVRLTPHWLAMADLLAVVVLVVGTAWSRSRARRRVLHVCRARAAGRFKAQTQHQALAAFQRFEHDSANPPEFWRALRSGQRLAVRVGYSTSERETSRAWRVDARSGSRRPLRAAIRSRGRGSPSAFKPRWSRPFSPWRTCRFRASNRSPAGGFSSGRTCAIARRAAAQSFGIELGAGGDPTQKSSRSGRSSNPERCPALTKSAP